MSGVIYCEQCGKMLRADNIYCTSCGNKLRHVPKSLIETSDYTEPKSLSETSDYTETKSEEKIVQIRQQTREQKPNLLQESDASSQDDMHDTLEPEGPAQEVLSSIVNAALEMDDEGKYPGSLLSVLDEYIAQYPENTGEALYYKGIILNHHLNPAPDATEIFSCFNRALDMGEKRAAVHLMRSVYNHGDEITVPHKPWEDYARISVYEAGDLQAATFLALIIVQGEIEEKFENEGHKLLVLTSVEGDAVLPRVLQGELIKISDDVFDLLVDSYSSTLSGLPQENAKFKLLSESLYDFACTYIDTTGDQWKSRILRIADLLSAYDCAPAYNLQGLVLEEGMTGERDLQGAKDYYKKAIELGDAEGLFRLGYLYLGESGETPNPVAAASYFRKAAVKNHGTATNSLIVLLRTERVPMEDDGELVRLLLNALEEGIISEDNAFYLASLYVEGTDNLAKDEQKAISILEAISEDFLDACVYLAYRYIETETEIEKVTEILEGAVAANHPMGLYTYGDFLLDKKDITQKDEIRALDFLERAYDLGIGLAAISLSTYYLRRCKDPLNYPRAIIWSLRALAIGFSSEVTKIAIDAVIEKACSENIDPLTGHATTEPQVWLKLDGGKIGNKIAIERGVVNSMPPLSLPSPDVAKQRPSKIEEEHEQIAEGSGLIKDEPKHPKINETAKLDSLPIEPQQQLWIIEHNNIRNTGDKTKALVYATQKHEAYPNSYFANYMLGVSKMDFGEIDDAVGCFNRALNAEPRPAESYERVSGILFDNGHHMHASVFAGVGLEKYPDSLPLFCIRFESLRLTNTPDTLRKQFAIEGKLVPKVCRDVYLAFSYYDDLFQLVDNVVIDGETDQRLLGEEKIKKAKVLVTKLNQTIPTDVPAEVTKTYPIFAKYLKEDIENLRAETKIVEDLIDFECKRKFIFEYAKIPLIALGASIFLFKYAGFLAFILFIFGLIGVLASRVPRWRLFAHHYPGTSLPEYNLFYAYRDFFRDISSSGD